MVLIGGEVDLDISLSLSLFSLKKIQKLWEESRDRASSSKSTMEKREYQRATMHGKEDGLL
jgi:hypothetical protein